jgi:putative transposase
LLENLAARLESEHPGAAASLREGLAETLTVIALRLTGWLRFTLRTTNPIDNLFGNASIAGARGRGADEVA